MDKYSEMIWQCGSAREIMQEARKRFRVDSRRNLLNAHVAFASVHYSLVKRYMAWWKKPVAAWHMWRASEHAHAAYNAAGADTFAAMTIDQIDVVTRIWSKSISRWPLQLAAEGIVFALAYHPERDGMKPHTRALMLITLGEIEYGSGNLEDSRRRIREAENLIRLVMKESSEDREQQLVRVLFGIGAFYREHHSGKTEFLWSQDYIEQALDLADRVSTDQAAKIRAWRGKLGVTR